MNIIKDYYDYCINIMQKVICTQEDLIVAASDTIVDCCIKGGRFYIFGSGHSHMIAEEIYLRAGGLALVKAILPGEVMLHEMPNKSTIVERLEGYGSSLLDLYKVDDTDTLLIVSNSGRNNIIIDMALEAKKRNIKTISISSFTF